MTREEFDTVWVQRLGNKGADELWRFKSRFWYYMCSNFAAGVGGVLFFGAGVLGKYFGVGAWVVSAWLIMEFVRDKRRLRVVMSERFGVQLQGIPPMNQRAFDRWVKYHGYQHPGA